MRPGSRMGLAGLGLALWFGVGAPSISSRIEAMRASTQVAPGVLPLASAIAAARPSLLPHTRPRRPAAA